MALRTTPERVKKVLQANYATRAAPSLDIYIQSANVLTNRLVREAAVEGISIDGETAGLIETWLAGYYYTKMDPLYLSKSTDGSGGSFQRNPVRNDYLQSAVELDPSGLLLSLVDPSQTAGAGWLGKADRDRIPYDQRN